MDALRSTSTARHLCMKMPASIRVLGATALLAALASTCGCASTAGTAALATGILAGAGITYSAATHSSVKAKVEVFDVSSLQKTSSDAAEAFTLEQDLAAVRSAKGQAGVIKDADPVANPTALRLAAVQGALAGPMDKLKEIQNQLTATQARFDTDIVQKAQNPEIKAKAQTAENDFTKQISTAQNVLLLWSIFDQQTNTAIKSPTDANLRIAADALLSLRNALAKAKGWHVSPEYLEALATPLQVEFVKLVSIIDPAKNAKLETDIYQLIPSEYENPSDPTDYRIAVVLYGARQMIDEFPPGTHAPDLDYIFRQFGLNIKSSDLVECHSIPEVQNLLDSRSPFLQLSPLCQQAIEITLNGLTNDSNLGPITNEVLQMVLTRSRAIGLISDPKNDKCWHSVNDAHAYCGPGNQDTVIYLENLGTPMIKSSAFDPTKYLVANAALYKRALSVTANVFGAPLGGSAAGGAGGAASGTNYNIFATRARVANDAENNKAANAEILAALKACLDAKKSIDSNATNDDWKDKKGTDTVKAIQQQLQDEATKLQTIAGDAAALTTPATPSTPTTPTKPSTSTPVPANSTTSAPSGPASSIATEIAPPSTNK